MTAFGIIYFVIMGLAMYLKLYYSRPSSWYKGPYSMALLIFSLVCFAGVFVVCRIGSKTKGQSLLWWRLMWALLTLGTLSGVAALF